MLIYNDIVIEFKDRTFTYKIKTYSTSIIYVSKKIRNRIKLSNKFITIYRSKNSMNNKDPKRHIKKDCKCENKFYKCYKIEIPRCHQNGTYYIDYKTFDIPLISFDQDDSLNKSSGFSCFSFIEDISYYDERTSTCGFGQYDQSYKAFFLLKYIENNKLKVKFLNGKYNFYSYIKSDFKDLSSDIFKTLSITDNIKIMYVSYNIYKRVIYSADKYDDGNDIIREHSSKPVLKVISL